VGGRAIVGVGAVVGKAIAVGLGAVVGVDPAAGTGAQAVSNRLVSKIKSTTFRLGRERKSGIIIFISYCHKGFAFKVIQYL
jgi:hypothetical protein